MSNNFMESVWIGYWSCFFPERLTKVKNFSSWAVKFCQMAFPELNYAICSKFCKTQWMLRISALGMSSVYAERQKEIEF